MTQAEILAKRQRIDDLSAMGKRIGYSLYAIAIVLFFVGFFDEYRPAIVTTITACLVIGSLLLAPAIVMAYGVKAAVHEENGGGSFH